MEANDNVLIINKKDLKNLFLSFIDEQKQQKLKDNDYEIFKEQKMSKPETIKMVGVSEPTFNRLVIAGRFKEYTVGKKKYYLRSEVLEALRTQSDAGKVAPYKPREKATIRSNKTAAKV
jgi:hypothetical protein